MTKTIKYTGAIDRWPELAITGSQAMWRLSQQEQRSDTEAEMLLLTGQFLLLQETPQYPMHVSVGVNRVATLPEGQILSVSGTAGTAGVVYRLDPVLGGTNSLQSWPVGAGALAPIGPFVGQQVFLVACTTGSVAVGNDNAAVSAARVTRDAAGVTVSVGDSSTQIPLRVNQLVGSMRAGGTGLPTATNSVSSGAGIKGFAGAISAWGPFHAVQLIFGNHTATPAVIDNSCVATSSTAYPGGVFNIAAPSSGRSSMSS